MNPISEAVDTLADFEAAVAEWATDNQMVCYRLFNDGMIAAVVPTFLQWRVVIGPALGYGYDRGYCYADLGRAFVAISAMTASSDEPDGWHKEVGTGRRRPDGDPTRETVDDE